METCEVKKRLGFWEGLGLISDDFNETPQEVLEALEASLESALSLDLPGGR